jgi:hypothetical protein
MLTYKTFCEAWINGIGSKGINATKDKAVTSSTKYDSPTDYERNAKKVGEVGGLELHSSETAGGGIKHFTWHPKDKKIHHVVYAAQSTPIQGGHRLQFLSAHRRSSSDVNMGQVYKKILQNGNQMVGTSHSPGAKKMWDRMRNDPDIHVHGEHPDGTKQELKHDDETHAAYGDKSKEGMRIGKMKLVAGARKSEM